MLRAKAIKFKKGDTRYRDNLITSTDLIGKAATAPLVNNIVNAANRNKTLRGVLDKALAIHEDARLPEYKRPTLRQQFQDKTPGGDGENKVLLFTTCYCNYNEPDIGASVIKVLEHNGVDVVLMNLEHCCGMPKLELGDLQTVERLMEKNIPELFEHASAGYSIVAAVPSCVLMFKQELPLMFPDDERVAAVARAFNDPFEYLFKLHREGRLNTDFKNALGDISYHVACHQRVQNIGPKTKQVLELIPDTTVTNIERCSGHDGTYGVKKETLKFANKIAAPIVRQIKQKEPDHFGSDCPVAGRHIENNLDNGKSHEHPIELLCKAYGLD
jgi:Fe-S oxidoreductase